jgi:hypothetical protein
MSTQNILERTGRGLTSLVAGDVATPSDAQQRTRGGEMISSLGAGGAMLGGGAAALVAALNLVKSLNEERKMEDETDLNDNTLYISDPKEKLRKKAAAGVSPLLAPGLAVTAGVVGGGASYALVQSIWNAAEKRRKQALLDEAQQEAIAAADMEVAKTATAVPPQSAPKFNLSDLLTATPVALPLLTMLATGGITYAALDKHFPVVSKQKHKGPKRIRVMREGQPAPLPEGVAPPEDGVEKLAAFELQDLDDAGSEFLASFVAASNPRTIIGSMINKAAAGGIETMEEIFKIAGVEALMASLKGQTDQPQDKRMLGTMALFKSAALADTARAIAVAEYLEIHGSVYDEIRGDDRHMRKLASLGCLMGIISRDSALPDLAKQASMMPPPVTPTSGGLLAALKEMLRGGQQGQGQGPQQAGVVQQGGTHQQREDRDAALTSDAGGGVGGVSEDGSDGASVAQESTGDDDVIDSIMSTGQPDQVLTPSG